MLRKQNKNFNFLFIITLICLAITNTCESFSENYVSTSQIISEIEKTLIFDKNPSLSSSGNKKSPKKKDDFVIKHESNNGENSQISSDIDIEVVSSKINSIDNEKKEKLAYNSSSIGQYEVAIYLYKKILQTDPSDARIKFALATNYQNIGQLKQAKKIYYELLKSDYENKDSVITNFLAIIIEESPKDAIYLISKIANQGQASPNILAHLAIAYERVNNYTSAISFLNRAIDLDPKNLEYQYNLAILYDKTKQYDKALPLYEKSLRKILTSSNLNKFSISNQISNRIEFIKNNNL